MAKSPNIYGGGSQTNINGLLFEQTTSLNDALILQGYEIKNDYCVFYKGVDIGKSVPKNAIYAEFLEIKGIDYKKYNSKKWQPDEAFINFNNSTVYIIEKKFQKGSGSVDEKLPNCHFKKLEYMKLFSPLNYKVEFIYILCDWFKDKQYKDVLEYIIDMGCHYYFNSVPLSCLGLNYSVFTVQ